MWDGSEYRVPRKPLRVPQVRQPCYKLFEVHNSPLQLYSVSRYFAVSICTLFFCSGNRSVASLLGGHILAVEGEKRLNFSTKSHSSFGI